MQFSLISVVSFASILTSAAAFDPRKDSCAPTDSTFASRKRNDAYECVVSRIATPTAIYDCGAAGQFIYDFKKNLARMVIKRRGFDGEFTIHGACFMQEKQVAHIDLYVPTKANTVDDKTYPGLNRICDLGAITGTSDSPWLRVHAYVLNPAELNRCAARPVKPIT